LSKTKADIYYVISETLDNVIANDFYFKEANYVCKLLCFDTVAAAKSLKSTCLTK